MVNLMRHSVAPSCSEYVNNYVAKPEHPDTDEVIGASVSTPEQSTAPKRKPPIPNAAAPSPKRSKGPSDMDKDRSTGGSQKNLLSWVKKTQHTSPEGKTNPPGTPNVPPPFSTNNSSMPTEFTSQQADDTEERGSNEATGSQKRANNHQVEDAAGGKEPTSTSTATSTSPQKRSTTANATFDEYVFDPIQAKESWSKLLSKRVVPRCEHNEPCISLLTKKPGINCGEPSLP